MKIFKWRNNLNFYLAIIFIVNLFLLRFPLTNVFGYEFAVVNSLLLVLLSAFYTLYFYKVFFRKNEKRFFKELFKSLALFLVIPLIVSIINSFITGFCSFCDGAFFYLFITFPAVLIGAAIGLAVNIYLKQFQIFLVIAVYLLILLIIGFEIYVNPQVYVYNPILAYFPGTIYDEAIAVGLKLIVYRLLNIFYFGFILFLAYKYLKSKKSKSKLKFTILVFIFPIIFYYFSPQFGYSTTLNSLSDKLGKTAVSEHFVTHFDHRIPDEKVKLIVLKEEFYYRQLVKYFKCKPKSKINSFIFYDNNQKKKLFGSKNADVAKPWLNQVYISEDNTEHTLKHEIAHCFSAEFGAGIFKLASGFNPLLIEGIAVAADGFYDENSIHFMAELAYKNNYRVDLAELLTKFGFYNQPSSISYIYAGSFVEFLVEKYGINKFKDYYLTGDITTTYGVTANFLIDEYYQFLDSSIKAVNIHKANYYFGRKSLFQKTCPRAISNLLNEAWEQFNKKEYKGARSIFSNILENSINYSAVVGLMKCYEKLDLPGESISLLQNYLKKYSGTSYYYNLELYLADLFAKDHKFPKADSLYRKLKKQKPNRSLYLLSCQRQKLLHQDSVIVKYLSGTDFDKYIIMERFNQHKYKYCTFPSWIYLAEYLNVEYDLFIKNINKRIIVNDFVSSYSAMLLSKYMLGKLRFKNALKISALSLRFNSNKNLNSMLVGQFEMAKWINNNYKEVFSNLIWSN